MHNMAHKAQTDKPGSKGN